jgi:hypothetical protein
MSKAQKCCALELATSLALDGLKAFLDDDVRAITKLKQTVRGRAVFSISELACASCDGSSVD